MRSSGKDQPSSHASSSSARERSPKRTLMISISDSDDDKKPKKPHCTPTLVKDMKKTLEKANKNPLSTQAQKANFVKDMKTSNFTAWPETRINESIRCVNKEHGDQCPGYMPSCDLKLVADLDGWREYVEKKQNPKELQEASAAEAEANESQHDFSDATQLPDFRDDDESQPRDDESQPLCDETQPDFFDATQLPDFGDETQPAF